MHIPPLNRTRGSREGVEKRGGREERGRRERKRGSRERNRRKKGKDGETSDKTKDRRQELLTNYR